MLKKITDNNLKFYEKHGYLIVKNVLNVTEILVLNFLKLFCFKLEILKKTFVIKLNF